MEGGVAISSILQTQLYPVLVYLLSLSEEGRSLNEREGMLGYEVDCCLPFLKKTENSSSGILRVCVEPPLYTMVWFHQYTQLEPDGNMTSIVDVLLIIGATRMFSPKR